MNRFQWHKMSDKVKAKIRAVRPKVFITGSIWMDDKRIEELIKTYASESILLFGILKEDYITGLEDHKQFKTLKADRVAEIADKSKHSKNVAILEYMFPHSKYVIKELKPSKVVFVNGGQRDILHSHPHYWEAVNLDAEIDLASPFFSEKVAKNYAEEIVEENKKEIHGKFENLKSIEKPQDDHFIEFCLNVAKNSWDWTGLTGALIVRDNEVLTYSHNTVLPYESAMLHEGSKREAKLSPRGEDQDLTETNHAEASCILNIAMKKETLKDSVMYCKAFPCPTCARLIAKSPIKKIFYTSEYANEIGYSLLKRVGKEIVRL